MRRHDRPVVVGSWIVLALLAAHDLTHALDDGLETSLGQLALVAGPQWLVLAVVMAVILRGDPDRRRTGALLLGAGVTLGFAVIHLLPFSVAAFWDQSPSVLSWVLAWTPAAAGLLLTALAWPRHGAARTAPAA